MSLGHFQKPSRLTRPLSRPQALLCAVRSGSCDSVLRALKFGADPSVARLPDGQTALHLAASLDSPDVVSALISTGLVDLEATDTFGNTSLACAAKTGSRCIKPLINAGARTGVSNVAGFTPLHFSAFCGDAESLRLLLRSGSDPEQLCESGTALHVAVVEGKAGCAEIMLAGGANPNARDVDGATPLVRAAFSGCLRCACVLLDHGADPNAADYRGLTPITAALESCLDRHCRRSMIALLLSAGSAVPMFGSAWGGRRITLRTIKLAEEFVSQREAAFKAPDNETAAIVRLCLGPDPASSWPSLLGCAKKRSEIARDAAEIMSPLLEGADSLDDDDPVPSFGFRGLVRLAVANVWVEAEGDRPGMASAQEKAQASAQVVQERGKLLRAAAAISMLRGRGIRARHSAQWPDSDEDSEDEQD